MLPGMTIDELALAVASANRIIVELLIANGVAPIAIESLAEKKANELVLSYQQNAGNFLRIMMGVA